MNCEIRKIYVGLLKTRALSLFIADKIGNRHVSMTKWSNISKDYVPFDGSSDACLHIIKELEQRAKMLRPREVPPKLGDGTQVRRGFLDI